MLLPPLGEAIDDGLLTSGKLLFVPTDSKDDTDGRCIDEAVETGRCRTERRRDVPRAEDDDEAD